jgi:hypothetical protein
MTFSEATALTRDLGDAGEVLDAQAKASHPE